MTATSTPSDKAAAGGGSPDDLVSGFISAVREDSPDTSQPLVAVAFSLGWYLSALCRERSVADAMGMDFAGIEETESINVCLRQVQVGWRKLSATVEAAGQTQLDTAQLAAAIEQGEQGDRSGPAERLNVDAFAILSAVDFRLGRSYRLGRDLLALTVRTTGEELLKDHLSDMAVAPIVSALDDLSSAMPEHAGHAVRASLVEWNGSVEGDGISKAVQDAVAPETAQTWAQLRRQGQIWRALLAGEKSGKDMLEIPDYIDAARGISVRMRNIAWRFLRDFWLLVLGVVALFAGGIAAMVATDSAATAAAGAGAILTSLGLSWRAIGAALGRLARQVEAPLWGAEIDGAVTRAITLLKPMKNRDTSSERQRFAVALDRGRTSG